MRLKNLGIFKDGRTTKRFGEILDEWNYERNGKKKSISS